MKIEDLGWRLATEQDADDRELKEYHYGRTYVRIDRKTFPLDWVTLSEHMPGEDVEATLKRCNAFIDEFPDEP